LTRGRAHGTAGCARPGVFAHACGLLAAAVAAVVMLVTAAPVYAGDWAIAGCANPNHTAAPSQGWSTFTTGAPGDGSNAGTSCTAGSPMFATLSSDAPAEAGAGENLEYAPPAGSSLVGGSLDVVMDADGHGSEAAATAVAYTPAFQYLASDVIFQCVAEATPPCGRESNNFSGVLALPADRGGDFYIGAGCGSGYHGAVCDEGAQQGAWSRVEVSWADFLLESDASPTGSGFSGSLLDANAHGTAELQFAAGDPGGPGVYTVTLEIDGHAVYQATPDGNEGHCVSVGSTAGALMFDYQQPCKQTEAVDIPVNTTTLSDGQHSLKVIVTDAAQNSSVVYQGTITTTNRTTVSSLLSSPLLGLAPAAEATYAIVLDKRTTALGKDISRSYQNSALTLSGQLRDAANAPAPGVSVSLLAEEGNEPAGTFTVLAHAITNAAGEWVLHAAKGPSRQLRILYGADTIVGAQNAVAIKETVHPTLGLNVSTPGGGRIVFSGRMAIGPIGSPRPLVTIETELGHEWEIVGHAIRVNANGTYRYVYRSSPLTLGRRFAFRAQTPATSLWQAGISPIRKAVVH
jgi:hypothetical protein